MSNKASSNRIESIGASELISEYVESSDCSLSKLMVRLRRRRLAKFRDGEFSKDPAALPICGRDGDEGVCTNLLFETLESKEFGFKQKRVKLAKSIANAKSSVPEKAEHIAKELAVARVTRRRIYLAAHVELDHLAAPPGSGPGEDSIAGFPDTVTIFPPMEGEMDLTEYPPVVVAQRDLARLRASSKEEEVNVIVDDEVDDQVVELLGTHANLGFHLEDIDLRFLVLHVKNMERYFRLEAVLQGSDEKFYQLSASNHQSTVRAQRQAASLPIVLAKGWNRICLDFEDICARAFGVKYKAIKELRVYANCRIWRLFFQDKNYGDASLPIHLRIVNP
ncbi:Cilia- and flagella-associated protein 20 [Hondaea fermentalgiana]|uniref:Cilia-and flagella-associated protein 20 n=1 Tax=Hondaea fermentalgiana TaxID=2315210 RepID=A0A2R5G490_9STRA|nr:Cilia- and flagella-associated protein 20 [Hondaea fermentalgiana]|eukprot:GBG25847.1 Cilia- and flagella-associated protein 20 [Hondaea fermentalgiana]